MMESQLVKGPAAERVSKWEELVYTRQFSYEWQGKDLQDTENERVRKRDNKRSCKSMLCGAKLKSCMSGKQRSYERGAFEANHGNGPIISADPILHYTISVLFVK
jgi:hypothetical protein